MMEVPFSFQSVSSASSRGGQLLIAFTRSGEKGNMAWNPFCEINYGGTFRVARTDKLTWKKNQHISLPELYPWSWSRERVWRQRRTSMFDTCVGRLEVTTNMFHMVL
ncbi:hypothetical protein BgiMline_003876, partial [Biomphalaria glabrata]